MKIMEWHHQQLLFLKGGLLNPETKYHQSYSMCFIKGIFVWWQQWSKPKA